MLGGSQTEAFILHPASLTLPREPIVGVESVGWRYSSPSTRFSRRLTIRNPIAESRIAPPAA